jgi:hypothetical protein
VARFQNGLQEGKWTYFNDKGRVIKEGSFAGGQPIGIWTSYDKSGKRVVAQYDFDSKQVKVSIGAERYFNKGGIARDDASGEWMVLHFPHRNIKSDVEPFAGYLLAGDLFLDYTSIPLIFMNTYAHYEFIAELKVSNGIVTVASIQEKASSEAFDANAPSFPFIVQTNAPNKLSRVQPTEESLKLLKDRLQEMMALAGPWITNGYEGIIKVQIPFVLNEIHKF